MNSNFLYWVVLTFLSQHLQFEHFVVVAAAVAADVAPVHLIRFFDSYFLEIGFLNENQASRCLRYLYLPDLKISLYYELVSILFYFPENQFLKNYFWLWKYSIESDSISFPPIFQLHPTYLMWPKLIFEILNFYPFEELR